MKKNNKTNVNMFAASRELAPHTADYFAAVLRRDEIKRTYQKKISGIEASIASLATMSKVDASGNRVLATKCYTTLDELDAAIAANNALIEALKDERKAVYASLSSFELSDADKALKKTADGSRSSVAVLSAIKTWAAAYNLDLANTNLLASISAAIGMSASAKNLVKSDGRDPLAYKGKAVLDTVYGVVFSYAVNAGTIKAAMIPDVLRDYYAPKKRGKKVC